MDTSQYLGVKEAAQLEGVSEGALLTRYRRKKIFLSHDPEDARRKLVPISALSSAASQARVKNQVTTALQGLTAPASEQAIVPARSGRPLQPLLAFAPPSPSDEARDAAIARVPKSQLAYVDRWMEEIAQNVNGTWRIHRGTVYNGVTVSHRSDFIRARAALIDVCVSNYHSKLGLARQILRDPAVPKADKWTRIAELLVPKPHPGRSGHDYFSDPDPEVAWQFPALRGFYLNQARHSANAATEMLLDLIEKKQRVWGLEKLYPKPTLGQCRTALAKIPKPELILGREGGKAFNDQCGAYLSRDPGSLAANDLWVMDQKQIDVRLRDGGERLGRIWLVTVMDVASERVLGYAFVPILSTDGVMMAVAMALERAGVPGAVHMDLGKEFICTAFNGSVRRFSGDALYQPVEGLWQRVGVRIVKAIGRNPQSKTIERQLHNNMVKFERTVPGFCGRKPKERPEELAAKEAQHEAWKRGEAVSTPLISIGDFISRFICWVENDWNGRARGRGKMRRGMTPLEAWNVKRPEAGIRALTPEQLDYYTADHRFVKVARGGQVNLTFFGCTVEYQAQELFLLQGEDVEVVISRRTFQKVGVLYRGKPLCEAQAKPLYAWLPEDREQLRAAMRCKAATHRAVRQGMKAQNLALNAANPIELLHAQSAAPVREALPGQKLFGSPAPLGHPETGSLEYLAGRPKRVFSTDLAREILELEAKE